MFTFIIRGGSVLDGTGAPPFAADLAAQGDAIRVLPAGAPAEAQQTIDAVGLVVTPGFIDIHTHAGLLPFASPGMDPFVRQGVTTVLVGLDGHSPAPYPSHAVFAEAMEQRAGLEGASADFTAWASVDGYLRAVDGRAACNVATLAGNGTLRLAALGWSEREASPQEQERMAHMLGDAMEQGAFGLSSGLTYPPSSHAQPSELAALCKVMQPFGGLYATHPRASSGDGFLDPVREALATARESGVPLHVAHLATPRPGGAGHILALVDQARAEGLDVTFDTQPYPYTTAPLLALLPEWAQAGGPQAIRARLRNKAERVRIAQDPAFHRRDYSAFLVTNLTHKRYVAFDGWPLESIAQAVEQPVAETLGDLLLTEGLGVSVVGLGGNPVNVRRFFSHPAHIVASAGAPVGAKPNPRTYGAFPSVLGGFCRDENLLTLSDAVRRMTSAPARRLGLRDRGRIWDGLKADLVVFDPALVASCADLKQPTQFPVGIAWVIVNGVPVVTPAGATGATPGRGLRRA